MSSMLRRLRRHRRIVLACLVFVAVWATLSILRSGPQTVSVVAAARDLPAGTSLAPGDLTTTTVLSDSVTTEFTDASAAIGRVLLTPLRAREPLGSTRLIDSRNIAAGHALVPLRLAQPEVARMLRPGDLIDVMSPTRVTGISARVVAVDASGSAALVLVDVAATSAQALAVASADTGVSATLRGNEGGS